MPSEEVKVNTFDRASSKKTRDAHQSNHDFNYEYKTTSILRTYIQEQKCFNIILNYCVLLKR